MQLLGLEFENVNSLAGKWSIDFSDEAFAREGLFAIVGSTGAGKTSILDAISLALYGKTARQEKATNAELAEVMTRDAAVCSCKVSFRGADGGKYRAEWEITRKTRRGSDGGVNAPAVKIYGLDPEIDLTPKSKNEAEALIVRKAGLDFPQFQRSVMLAQGQFDKFLTAGDADRAAILAQAAGTDVFARIGTRIFEKAQASGRKVDAILLRRGENIPLSPEERLELEARKNDAAIVAESAGKRLEELRNELSWHEEEERLKSEWSAIESRRAELEALLETLAPGEKTLEEAETARTLLGAHAALERLREAHGAAEAEERRCSAGVGEAEETASRTAEAVSGLEERFRAAAARRENAAPAIEQASRLDLEIAKARGDEKAAGAARDAAVAAGNRIRRELGNLETALAALVPELAYLEELRRTPCPEVPETVDPGLAGIALERRKLQSLAADSVAAEKKAGAVFEAREKEFARATDVYNAEQPQIDARIKDASRMLRAMQAMDYDAVRKNLRPGDRCPVCGKPVDGTVSTDLPLASEFERAFDEALAAKKRSGEAFNAARDRRNEAERAAKAAGAKRKAESEELERLERALAERETRTRTRIQEAASRRESLQTEAEETAGSAATLSKALETAEKRLAALLERRKALNLPDNPARFGKSLDEAVETAAKALSEGRGRAAAANARRAQLLETLEGVRKKAADAAARRAEAEAGFASAAGAMGYADEAAWRTACGDDRVLEAIRRNKADFSEKAAALKEAQTKFSGDKARHDAGEGSKRRREEVAAGIAAAEANRSEAERGLGDCLARIEADDACLRKSEELAKELETAQAEHAAWSRLNKLLGGSGGFRFSQYAQGLTLRALLNEANPFLARMSGGRYSLLWRPAKSADSDEGKKGQDGKTAMLLPLIVDHDQHDTARPISNVSGGERFEVSLALALGLSKMNSGRVKVETMFLDEGFGTLDPERLGAALDVLCGLHGEGATIGVISHVKAVEERLPLKIRVEPAGRGFGRLVGEGAISRAVSGTSLLPASPRRRSRKK